MRIDRHTYQESFNEPAERARERGTVRDVVVMGDMRFTRYTLEPDGRWTHDDGAAEETEWRLLPHRGVQLTGRLHCVLSNGSEFESGPNDLLILPDGVDSWVVGTEPVVFIDIEQLGETDGCCDLAFPDDAAIQAGPPKEDARQAESARITDEPGQSRAQRGKKREGPAGRLNLGLRR